MSEYASTVDLLRVHQFFNVKVSNKIGVCDDTYKIIAGNTDWAIQFIFDDEWKDYTDKFCRFLFSDGTDIHIRLNINNQAVCPELTETFEGPTPGWIQIGVYAINYTTTDNPPIIALSMANEVLISCIKSGYTPDKDPQYNGNKIYMGLGDGGETAGEGWRWNGTLIHDEEIAQIFTRTTDSPINGVQFLFPTHEENDIKPEGILSFPVYLTNNLNGWVDLNKEYYLKFQLITLKNLCCYFTYHNQDGKEIWRGKMFGLNYQDNSLLIIKLPKLYGLTDHEYASLKLHVFRLDEQPEDINVNILQIINLSITEEKGADIIDGIRVSTTNYISRPDNLIRYEKYSLLRSWEVNNGEMTQEVLNGDSTYGIRIFRPTEVSDKCGIIYTIYPNYGEWFINDEEISNYTISTGIFNGTDIDIKLTITSGNSLYSKTIPSRSYSSISNKFLMHAPKNTPFLIKLAVEGDAVGKTIILENLRMINGSGTLPQEPYEYNPISGGISVSGGAY